MTSTVLVETTETLVINEDLGTSEIVIISEGPQGPQGPQGPPGTSVDPADFFQVLNRFSELTDETAKTEARSNLGLQYIDGGTFN